MDPASAYRNHLVEGSTPIGLIVLLYQSAVSLLRRAIAAMEAGDVEQRTLLLNRVLRHLAELKGVLDFERGGAVAEQLSRFYTIADGMVLDASCRQDPEPLRVLVQQLLTVQEAWQQLDAMPRSAPQPVPVPFPQSAGEVRQAWQA